MKRVFCAVLVLALMLPVFAISVCADEDYPDSGQIADVYYRNMIFGNELNSRSELGSYVHNGSVSVTGGIASYTAQNEDNGLYFVVSASMNLPEVNTIEIKVKMSAQATLKFYYAKGSSYSEARTFLLSDIPATDGFQTIYVDTASISGWSGSMGQYRISVVDGVGKPVQFDYVRFYGDYKPMYTESDRSIIYDFVSRNYGFTGSDGVSDEVVYNDMLWARVTGPDASLTTSAENFEIDAENIPQIRVLYKNQTQGTEGRLYFLTDSSDGYSDAQSFSFAITPDSTREYAVDTADNVLWKGKITGLRFVPSNAEGIVQIDYIRFDKFPCKIVSYGGIISGSGNLYGIAGRTLSFFVSDAETDAQVYSGTAETDDNGDFSFSFEIPQAPDELTYYNITFDGPGLTWNYRKKVLYASQGYIKNTMDKIKAAQANNDAPLLGKLIEDNYGTMSMQCKFYKEFAKAGVHLDELYAILASGSVADLPELESKIDETIVVLRTKYMTAEEWLTAIDDYDEYLNIKTLPAYETYKNATENVKKEIVGKISKDGAADIAAVRVAFEKYTVLTALRNAVAWADVKEILKANAILLGIDLTSADSAVTSSEIYRQLTEGDYSSLSAVKDAFDSAVAAQIQKEKENATVSGGGGGGSSKGSSKGSWPSVGVLTPSTTAAETPEQTAKPLFSDLESFEWASDAISRLYDKKIIDGTGKGNFEPQRQIRREEFVKMLAAALNLPLSGKTDFADVNETEWYSVYIAAAVKAEIVQGQGAAFGVGETLTRQDAAVMAARALNYGEKADITDFSDYDEISDYAKNAVCALTQTGVISGYGDGTFRPNDVLTRAEAAVILDKIIGGIAR